MLLKNPSELDQLIASSKPKRKTFSKPRNSTLNTTASSSNSSPSKKIKSPLNSSTCSKTPNPAKKNVKSKSVSQKSTKNSNTLRSLKTSVVVQNGKAKERDQETPSRVVPKRKSSSQIRK